MDERLGRRAFLGAAGGGAALLAGCTGSRAPRSADPTAAATPAWWRAQSHGPGQHALKPLPYATDALVLPEAKLRGISAQTVAWHHDRHQAGYVKALNGIELDVEQLSTIAPDSADETFGDLKRRETFNASGVVLHEIYWDRLTPGGAPRSADMNVVGKLAADFGSFERWREEFVGTAGTPSNGWAILALTPHDRRLHNYACSMHELGGVWGAAPLLALDVWEHAYYHDYGPDRAAYIESWFRLVNWPAVEAAFLAAARSL
ncbi:MAG: superoxide dismutase [Armatimonadetes bacterium]|nr:superoxide dismutase [Armatimonadota bacterium]